MQTTIRKTFENTWKHDRRQTGIKMNGTRIKTGAWRTVIVLVMPMCTTRTVIVLLLPSWTSRSVVRRCRRCSEGLATFVTHAPQLVGLGLEESLVSADRVEVVQPRVHLAPAHVFVSIRHPEN